jgi:Leucine rich repeat
MVELTKDLILSKTRMTKLSEVKSLSLWGQGLTNMDICSDLGAVEVLSLSCNKISSLQPFAACANLRELYLRRNEVQTTFLLRDKHCTTLASLRFAVTRSACANSSACMHRLHYAFPWTCLAFTGGLWRHRYQPSMTSILTWVCILRHAWVLADPRS